MKFEELKNKLPWMEIKESEWHQHKNGGGWVKNTAAVSEACRVEGIVFGDAQVSGNAQVFGDARVFGNARVFGEAQVSGNARVSGDARVFGNARVFGEARVFGNARVSGDAQVSGDAWVFGNARVFGDAWETTPFFIAASRHSVATCTHTKIQIGCQCLTAEDWLKNYERIGRENGYTPDQIAEYGMILRFVSDWLKMKFGTNKPKRDARGRFASNK